MNTSGKLIMLDGPDGAGKTTQFDLLVASLEKQGQKIYTAHMLGGTPIGEALRSVMFSDAERPALTNLYLSLAIYVALAKEVTQKQAEGYTVIIDRSPLSLIAYQVYGDGVDETLGYEACDQSLASYKPDSLLVYTAPALILAGRRAQRDEALDYFEKQKLDYHERTARGYEVAAARYKAQVIDASPSIEQVHRATMQIIENL